MSRALVLAAVLALATGAAAPAAPPAHASAAAKAHTPPITDPQAFVAGVYRRLASDENYTPPEDIYTPHLAALWADMTHDAGGEVGRVDFEFWINAQDWKIKDVKVTSAPAEGNAGRRIVIARFANMDRAEEIHFYFQRVGTRWLLDDARSAGKDGWTLSVILKYGWDGE